MVKVDFVRKYGNFEVSVWIDHLWDHSGKTLIDPLKIPPGFDIFCPLKKVGKIIIFATKTELTEKFCGISVIASSIEWLQTQIE